MIVFSLLARLYEMIVSRFMARFFHIVDLVILTSLPIHDGFRVSDALAVCDCFDSYGAFSAYGGFPRPDSLAISDCF
jgi:hypothetical protein